MVVIYKEFKYVIEMKIWRSAKYHEDEIKQLIHYLDIHDLNEAHLVILNFNKARNLKKKKQKLEGKIF
ncbi:hypothetical protein [Clostridium gasigenes]|uniref:hypothetical protein n=1 Tax=Clostridium gasigenes TaxID=94869 RepID=UPI001C0CDA16|nr:hypothetical protein [Clostridium gasigenes]MBU3103559.1 hypothetical protein [Clostridium gasigenes]